MTQAINLQFTMYCVLYYTNKFCYSCRLDDDIIHHVLCAIIIKPIVFLKKYNFVFLNEGKFNFKIHCCVTDI